MPAPSVLPGRISQRVDRKSRLLFHWRAADLSLDPVTKETPTFVRATGGGLTRDVNGNLGDYAQYQPRFEMSDPVTAGVFDTPGLLIEGQRTNLVVQSEAITAAAGWSVGALGTTAGYSALGALSFTRLTGITISDAARVVTLTGDGAKAFSFFLQFDGVVGNTVHQWYDSTAAAFRAKLVVTWAADGTATAVATVGTLLQFVALGNQAYRALMQTAACVAANVNNVYATASSAATATSIRVGGVQAEDALVPSSYIKTTTAAVTRNMDQLNYAFLPVPQSMTVYAKFTNRGGETILGGTILASQTNGAPPRWFLWHESVAAGWQLRHDNAVSVSSTTAGFGAHGDRVELLGQFFSDGSVQLSQSINGGAVTSAARSGANAFAAAWSRAVLDVNGNLDGHNKGGYALHELKIAAGLLTMAQIREMF